MTIISATEMWSRDSAATSVSADLKTRTIQLKSGWQIVTSADATKFEVLAANDLPKVGDLIAGGNGRVRVRNVSPQRVSPILWVADVSAEGEFGPAGPDDDPVNKPPEIEWTDAETDEAIDTDATGAPIVTVNGEPIYGVTAKWPDQILNIKRNFRRINPYSIGAYRRSVSSDSYLGWPPGTAKLIKYSARNVIDERTGYWQVTAAIQFRYPIHTTAENAWAARVRHEGLYELKDGQIVRAVDRFGEFVTKPVLLKADGTRETDINNAHWLLFKRYPPLPYSVLGLI